ncbi:hypothetical protein [Actinoallomurus iriomotensis]|uniref:Bulb-type lectin domain-containing protein n=1 Tax=Actinoallomurus iriomotensis TaxID=478107 RepID=A0A9W6RT36_9ACTN|nr:hypothetical protein [Actinoallomurus iriomotensis]GLY79692.1 hypothetical protein Airi01_079590 [Actinoallomurus iriomotensis]
MKNTDASSESGSGERTNQLGVRRPVELPDVDIHAAAELVTADSASAAKSGAPAASASAGETAGGLKEKTGDAGAQSTAAAEAKEPEPVSPTAVDPDTGDGGMPPGRPKKPMLAAAGIGGAILLAIPILLVGRGSHDHEKQRTDAAGNMLAPDGGQQPPGAFVPASPSATASPSTSSSASPSASAKAKSSAKPKGKSKGKTLAEPKRSAKKGSSASRVSANSVPSSELPKSGGAPYALEVHSALDLHPGDTWRTNVIALTMQRGGNLVLRNKRGRIIWSSGTHRAGVYCELQTDGNLVIYAGKRTAVWAAGTYGHPNATLVLQADSNMVIYDGHNAIWATNTQA